MREFGRFKQAGREFYAAVAEGVAVDLPEGPFGAAAASGAQRAVDDLVVLVPTEPGWVVEAVFDSAEATGSPRFRTRAPSTLIPHRAMVPLPAGAHRFSVHPRLALVVGRPIHRVDAKAAHSAILGWAAAITFRDETLLDADPGSAGAFNHAGFAAIGPTVSLAARVHPGVPTLWHNGREIPPRAGGGLDPAQILAAASDWAVFQPGDLVLIGVEGTGAESRPGDHLECRCAALWPVALNVGLRGSA